MYLYRKICIAKLVQTSYAANKYKNAINRSWYCLWSTWWKFLIIIRVLIIIRKKDSYDTQLNKLKSEEFNSRCYKYEEIRENYISILLYKININIILICLYYFLKSLFSIYYICLSFLYLLVRDYSCTINACLTVQITIRFVQYV